MNYLNFLVKSRIFVSVGFLFWLDEFELSGPWFSATQLFVFPISGGGGVWRRSSPQINIFKIESFNHILKQISFVLLSHYLLTRAGLRVDSRMGLGGPECGCINPWNGPWVFTDFSASLALLGHTDWNSCRISEIIPKILHKEHTLQHCSNSLLSNEILSNFRGSTIRIECYNSDQCELQNCTQDIIMGNLTTTDFAETVAVTINAGCTVRSLFH